ncbi:MAG: sugar phosphate nucleotidyltransferase, partial [Alphaproteobacteria bacterium]
MTIRAKVRFRMKNNHIVKDAFILSAGLGKRLLPYTKYNPKPLVPINEKPMIEYILD